MNDSIKGRARARAGEVHPCQNIPQGNRNDTGKPGGYDPLIKWERRGAPTLRTEFDAQRDNIESPVVAALFNASERL